MASWLNADAVFGTVQSTYTAGSSASLSVTMSQGTFPVNQPGQVFSIVVNPNVNPGAAGVIPTDNATTERAIVTAVTGSGPYSLYIPAGLAHNHSIGENVVLVISTNQTQDFSLSGGNQVVTRRAGSVGVATSPDTAPAFPFGQIEALIGDSIAAGLGGVPGTTDWPSRISNLEARYLGLPDAGLGWVYPCGGALIPASPQFLSPVAGNGGAGLTNVAGFCDGYGTANGTQFKAMQLNAGAGSTIAVTNATGTTTVTITAAGTWTTGQVVIIASVGGITNVNGAQTISAGGSGTFNFVPATAASGSYTSGGTVTSTVTDNRPFNRVLVFYKPQTNSDGIGVSINGGVSTLATIDGTYTSRSVTDAVTNGTTTVTSATAAFITYDVGQLVSGTNIKSGTTVASRTNGTTIVLSQAATGSGTGGNLTIGSGNANVAFWDSGTVTGGTVAGNPGILSLFRNTHVTGSGGVAPVVYGVHYFSPGNVGTSGMTFDNLSISGTTTAFWVQNRTWESYIGLVAPLLRRVHITLGANDQTARGTTSGGVTLTNGSPNITDTNITFTTNDIGRPISGANIPANSFIGSIGAAPSTNSATLSSSSTSNVPVNATGTASGTYTYGSYLNATTTANLNTIIARIRAQAPNVAITLCGEYHLGIASGASNYKSQAYWQTTFIPMMESIATANNCTFVNLYDQVGSVSYIRYAPSSDITIANASNSITSASAFSFAATDVGSLISGPNIPPNTTIISVTSSTVALMSNNATGTASGGTAAYALGNDVYGMSLDGGAHLGDGSSSVTDGQRLISNAYWEVCKYANTLPPPPLGLGQVTLTAASGSWLCPATGTWEVICVASGGSGGGGGANTSTTISTGGSGGGPGGVIRAEMSLTAGTAYAYTIGASVAGGNGGAAGGANAGAAGAAGQQTSFSGPTTVTAQGGGQGQGGAATTATTNIAGGAWGIGGVIGIVTSSGVPQLPGQGGTANGPLTSATAGGAVDLVAGGGGGGNSNATPKGGNAGGPGVNGAGGALGAAGGQLTGQGQDATAAGANSGCGGGGGGGGNNSLRGGNGGASGSGVIYLRKVG